MKKSKIAFAAASALLLTTSLSYSQTTISGNMRIGYKANESKRTPQYSGGMFTKETQLNIANKGKTNLGLDYEAGFSLELDGNDGAAIGATTEGNYISFINPSSATTIAFSSDRVKPSDVDYHDILGTPASIGNVSSFTAAGTDTFYGGSMSGKGKSDAFSVGIVQGLSNLLTVSAVYIPDTGAQLGDTGASDMNASTSSNSKYDIGARGSLGVKGLDVHAGYNKQDGTGTDKDIKYDTQGIKYTMGQITVAAQQASATYNTNGSKMKSKEFGLAYAVTPTLTIGYANITTDESQAATVKEKIQGIAIGYNLGPVALSTVATKVDDHRGVSGTDGKAIIVQLQTTF